MTEIEIARLLTRTNGPFDYRRYVCVANVSWGLLPWECDLAAMSPSNWLTEIEIKVSISDLRRDAGKEKHALWGYVSPNPRGKGPQLIRHFVYALPAEIWAKVEDSPPIPEYAGVCVVDAETPNPWQRSRWVRKPLPNKAARKLTADEAFQLGRLGSMRFWTRAAA